MKIIAHPSPNFGDRRGCDAPDMIVIHYTGMATAQAALDRLCDPGPEVSCHYLIDENGGIYQLVDDACRAWHAGRSYWQGQTDINSRSIGIELANPGPLVGSPPFAARQMDALAQMLEKLCARWGIAADCVLGHADVAPGRKADPGAKFDWDRFGLRRSVRVDRNPDRALLALGYDPEASPAARLGAAQLRFRLVDAPVPSA